MKERKLPIFFFSLLFAVLVWASINLGNQFQTYIEVPVHVENLRPDQAIATPLPNSVRFRIEGTGWQILNTMLSPNLRYTIDFTSLSRQTVLFTSRELNERVNLSKEIRVYETLPETVVVTLDEKTVKSVPIVPVVNVSFRDGFGVVGTVKSVPANVMLTGSKTLLSRIHQWKTEPVIMNDINAPVAMSVRLKDSLQFEVERSTSVSEVQFDVQPIAEKTISDIEVEIIQVPNNRNVVLIPPKVSIIVRSGVNNVANLTAADFYAFVDYKSILLDTSGTISPSITGPENIKIVIQNPEKIQYVVRK